MIQQSSLAARVGLSGRPLMFEISKITLVVTCTVCGLIGKHVYPSLTTDYDCTTDNDCQKSYSM